MQYKNSVVFWTDCNERASLHFPKRCASDIDKKDYIKYLAIIYLATQIP